MPKHFFCRASFLYEGAGARSELSLRRAAAVVGQVEVVVLSSEGRLDRVHIIGLLGRRNGKSTRDGWTEHERSPSSGDYWKQNVKNNKSDIIIYIPYVMSSTT